jgi:hypothetical protein
VRFSRLAMHAIKYQNNIKEQGGKTLMRILDLLKRAKPTKELVLDDNAPVHWPQKLLEHRNLDDEFKAFVNHLNKLTEETRRSLQKFTNEDVLASIPDRARTMNALHGNEYVSQVNKLLATIQFSDIFTFEKQQDSYFEANSAFKSSSTKHANVLKEFLHDELKTTQTHLQQIEDTIINFTKVLEEKGFPQIKKIQEINLRLQKMTELQDKYQKLLESLEIDRKRTNEKRVKIEEDIKEQQTLVRNEESLHALEKIRKIDEELFKIAAQYASLCEDVLAIYKKNSSLELQVPVKKMLEVLPKDPLAFINTNAEVIKQTFEGIVTQFEEERPGNVKSVVERLSRLSQTVEQDARKIQTAAPDQRALKKEMMKDIAALNIYDKMQFLLRAQAEEDNIVRKLNYLQAEMDPKKKIELQREMRDIAHSFGALIKSEEQKQQAS